MLSKGIQMSQGGSRIQGIAGGLLRRPVAVSMIYAALVAGGPFALRRLPLDLAPSVEFPALAVQTDWPGVSAETVEMMLTAPIEETGSTIFGVQNINSVSSEGLSRVSFEFRQETRMDFARLELNEKLAALFRTLPGGIGQPAIEPYIPEDFRNLHGFMSYSLAGVRPASVLRKLGQEVIVPCLRSIRGVANVVVYGGEEEEIRIELDAKKIEALGLNIDDVTGGLSVLEFNAPVGGFTDGSRRHIVSVRNAGLGLDELGRTPIARNAHGSPIRIKDIGAVRMATADPVSLFRINGRPCVTLVIGKDPSVNTLRLSDAVVARTGELRASLPDGVELILESDTSAEMRAELAALSRDAAFSLLCILVVLFLFLGNLKAPLVVLSSICFSLAGTFLAFWVLGIGLHLLSLAGLVLGFGRLVDDSIVVLDNVQRRGHGRSSPGTITTAVGEIALPVVASTVTTVGALLPTAFLPDDLKPYFIEFSLAVGISLLMSLTVSFTLIPVLAARLRLTPVMPGMYARAGAWGFRAYAWLLKKALSRKATVLLFVVWLFGIPVWLLPERVSSGGIPASSYNAIFGSNWYRAARPYMNYLLGGASHLFFAKVEKGESW
jgi:multidrug efflux pump subunit AcrB